MQIGDTNYYVSSLSLHKDPLVPVQPVHRVLIYDLFVDDVEAADEHTFATLEAFDKICHIYNVTPRDKVSLAMVCKSKVLDKASIGWATRDTAIVNNHTLDVDLVKMFGSTTTFYKGLGVGSTALRISKIFDEIHSLLAECKESLPIHLTFFTNSSVDPDCSTEDLAAMHKSISDCGMYLNGALFVGYDRASLSSMAADVSGVVISADDYSDVVKNKSTYSINKTASGSYVRLELPPLTQVAFGTYANKDIITLKIENNACFVPSECQIVYCVSEIYSQEYVSDTVLYSAALASVQSEKMYFIALKILDFLGDSYIVNKVLESHTRADRIALEKILDEAIKNNKARYILGRQERSIFDPENICVLDVVSALSELDAELLVDSEQFTYNRGTKSKRPVEGSPVFNKTKTECKFSSIVWHSHLLNLSLRARQDGIVTMPEEAIGRGLDKNYKTFRHRTFTIIRDGSVVMPKLIVQIPASDGISSLYDRLGNNILSLGDDEYVIDISNMPIVSLSTKVSLDHLCELLYNQVVYEALQKVFNYYYKPRSEERRDFYSVSKEKELLLREYGITSSGFSPKMEDEDDESYFKFARSFDISIKGLKSIPSVDTVLAKSESTRKLTPAQSLVQDAILRFKMLDLDNLGSEDYANTVRDELKAIRKILNRLRSAIHRIKFTLLLSKQPVLEDGITISPDLSEYEWNGHVFQINVTNVVERTDAVK